MVRVFLEGGKLEINLFPEEDKEIFEIINNIITQRLKEPKKINIIRLRAVPIKIYRKNQKFEYEFEVEGLGVTEEGEMITFTIVVEEIACEPLKLWHNEDVKTVFLESNKEYVQLEMNIPAKEIIMRFWRRLRVEE